MTGWFVQPYNLYNARNTPMGSLFPKLGKIIVVKVYTVTVEGGLFMTILPLLGFTESKQNINTVTPRSACGEHVVGDHNLCR